MSSFLNKIGFRNGNMVLRFTMEDFSQGIENIFNNGLGQFSNRKLKPGTKMYLTSEHTANFMWFGEATEQDSSEYLHGLANKTKNTKFPVKLESYEWDDKTKISIGTFVVQSVPSAEPSYIAEDGTKYTGALPTPSRLAMIIFGVVTVSFLTTVTVKSLEVVIVEGGTGLKIFGIGIVGVALMSKYATIKEINNNG